ncbi:MAG: aminomethyl-transferring glycine dehydrogenase subunit GcvPB [Acidimicrobiales bacterium]
MGREAEPTIFELSSPGRRSASFRRTGLESLPDGDEWGIPGRLLRAQPVDLVELSERDLVAHFTRLAHRQYSVDLGAYPLGSCTMKYNPKLADQAAGLVGFTGVHPAAPARLTQGWMALMDELERAICTVTGMYAATLAPPAGAAGELTGLLMMRAWHADQGEGHRRRRVLIPDSAHGTNPASVVLGGYQVTQVPSDAGGCVDLDALEARLDDDVAGIMLTNPNTLGLFEESILAISAAVHRAGGLLYYDGANLNAILGVTRPGDMGFDIVHSNLHKTFAVPHGGGGPGAGPVAVTERLAPYLPGPRPVRSGNGASGHGSVGDAVGGYHWEWPARSIGPVHSWHGNALALVRAWAYIEALGGDGLRQVAQVSVLNANWLRWRLRNSFEVVHDRACMHEFVLTMESLRRHNGLRAIDVAKHLLDEGFHAPTVNFPLVVPEALMIEPTETESPQTLEALAQALERAVQRCWDFDPESAEPAVAIRSGLPGPVAPFNTPVTRVDETTAARRLIPIWDVASG